MYFFGWNLTTTGSEGGVPERQMVGGWERGLAD